MGADSHDPAGWPAGREILYVLDLAPAPSGLGLILHVHTRRRKATGGWQVFTSVPAVGGQIDDLPDPADREIFGLMVGTADAYGYAWHYQWSLRRALSTRHVIPAPLQGTLIPLLCRTGRLQLRLPSGQESPVEWDDGPPWDLHLEVARDGAAGGYAVSASLRRGDEQLALSSLELMLPAGFVFSGGRCARLAHPGTFAWISELRRGGPITVPASEAEEWLAGLLRLPALPSLALPPELRYDEVAVSPAPRLAVRMAPRERQAQVLWGTLSFDYEGVLVDAHEPGRGRFQRGQRRLIVRDAAAEQRAAARLLELGFRPAAADRHGGPALELAPRLLPRATRDLVREGMARRGGGPLVSVSRRRHACEVATRIDWFELKRCGRRSATCRRPLPAVLAAARRGDTVVPLGDGTFGVLPEEWLARYGLLAGLGTSEGDGLRFARSQAGLLDALLGSQPGAAWDEGFARAREALHRFGGVDARGPAGRLPGRAAGLPAGRTRLARVLAAVRVRRLPRGRHGAGQDGAGAGAPAGAPGRRGRAVARRRAEVARVQLEAGGRPVCARAALPRPYRHRAKHARGPLPRVRRRPHHVRDAPPGRRRAVGVRVRLRHPRRGAGDQERGDGDREGGAPAARGPPACAQRHARWRTILASSGASSSF